MGLFLPSLVYLSMISLFPEIFRYIHTYHHFPLSFTQSSQHSIELWIALSSFLMLILHKNQSFEYKKSIYLFTDFSVKWALCVQSHCSPGNSWVLKGSDLSELDMLEKLPFYLYGVLKYFFDPGF